MAKSLVSCFFLTHGVYSAEIKNRTTLQSRHNTHTLKCFSSNVHCSAAVRLTDVALTYLLIQHGHCAQYHVCLLVRAV